MQNYTEYGEFDIELWSKVMEKIVTKDIQWPPYFMFSMIFLIFITALLGNLLTCIVIYYDKTMHTITNYYLFNLAVSDLSVTFAILLTALEAFGSANYPFLHFTFGELACKIRYLLVVGLWNNGILIMSALTVERYIAIRYPLMFKSTNVRRRVMKVVMAIWIVAIVETLPEFWTIRLIETEKMPMCLILPTLTAKIVNAVLAVVTFLVPLVMMTVIYGVIAYQMHVAQKKNSRGRIFNRRNNNSKINKLTVTLTLAFVVCWVPFATIRIFIVTVDVRKLMEADEVHIPQWWTLWYQISALNNIFSAVLNPLLFSLMSTKFRRSLKVLWNKTLRRHQQRA